MKRIEPIKCFKKPITEEEKKDLITSWKRFLLTFEKLGIKFIEKDTCAVSLSDHCRLILEYIDHKMKEN